jgi:hypothetical protein
MFLFCLFNFFLGQATTCKFLELFKSINVILVVIVDLGMVNHDDALCLCKLHNFSAQ